MGCPKFYPVNQQKRNSLVGLSLVTIKIAIRVSKALTIGYCWFGWIVRTMWLFMYVVLIHTLVELSLLFSPNIVMEVLLDGSD